MDQVTAIVTQQLNSLTIAQLATASHAPWAGTAQRNSVRDLIIVENGHVIINPGSIKEMGAIVGSVFENGAKQAIYGVFDIILGTYSSIAVGMYELAGDTNVAYTRKAKLFANLEGHGWTAFHTMNGKYIPMDLPQDGSATEAMRLKHEWLDLIVRGAYIDIDVATYAPQMYDYFGSLLAMTPPQAIQTINSHVANKRERRLAWAASQSEDVTPLDTITVDGEAYDPNAVKGFKKLFARKGERVFTAGTQSAAEQSHLAYLLQNGYTLSRSL